MTFIGPACMTKMVRVGVIWMFVMFASSDPSLPIHRYVVPFTLILPSQPMVDFGPWALRFKIHRPSRRTGNSPSGSRTGANYLSEGWNRSRSRTIHLSMES